MKPFISPQSGEFAARISGPAGLPLLLVIGTGILLQLKKESAWIQPPTQKGSGGPPEIRFERILAAARTVPEAGVETWDDVDRLDVRPGRGVVKVRARSGWEVQVDTTTGAVLQSAIRRSDLTESLHDGSFFHDDVRLWIFLPMAVVLFGLWVSGVYLFLLPHLKHKEGRRRKARLTRDRAAPRDQAVDPGQRAAGVVRLSRVASDGCGESPRRRAAVPPLCRSAPQRSPVQ